jgi:hypothetical protein
MSNSKPVAKKTVKINENDLVDLIDNIVKEAVEKKKVEWIAEQESNKANLLESKIARLEESIARITKGNK